MTVSRPPLVTIGLPVYNSERYVRQSLDSLLNQTFTDFTLIISDNASTDSTSQICREYAAADTRIQYFRNDSNIGNPRNFNRVAELANSRYLKWSTADDYWLPTFLERALDVLERDDTIALCYPQAVLVDADGANPHNYEDSLHLMDNDPAQRFVNLIRTIKLAHQHLGLIRLSLLRRTRLLGTHIASDLNLLAELSLYGKFFELPERLFYRRFHKESGSWKRGDVAHELRRYHASNARNVALSKWKRHFSFLSSVGRSPLPLHSKMRLYAFLARRINWDRHDLGLELTDFARAAWSRHSAKRQSV